MGYYIEAPHKLVWLRVHGRPLTDYEVRHFDFGSSKEVPVCWVQNRSFDAAGVAYSRDERDRFIQGMSGREHQWFAVPHHDVMANTGYSVGDMREGDR